MFLFRLTATLLLALAVPALAQDPPAGRISGRILDAYQAQPLPGATVEVVGTSTMTVTDIDGRFNLRLATGARQIKVTLPGFTERVLNVEVPADSTEVVVDATLSVAGLAETVSVSADGDAATAAVQLLERRRANVISDNLGGQEMKVNADSNAASALQRVTGLSVVDNQYVFVRGLGERYSNTTLNGATLPSTEPERKVVSLDMFPATMLESLSVVKTFTPDRSAEFAGGMVEIVPNRQTAQRVSSFSYTVGAGNAWGDTILDHSGGRRDWLGLPNGDRAMPAAFPDDKRLVRGGIYTPDVGVSRDELEQYGEMLPNTWSPESQSGRPNQAFSGSYGDRIGKFGFSGSLSQSYAQDYTEEEQVYYNTDGAGNLFPFSTYDYNVGSARGSLSGLVNASFAASANDRVTFQAFTTDKSKRETRTFEGYNDDAARNLRNSRLLYQEDSLRSYQFGGDHFLPSLSSSRIEWRGTYSKTSSDQPDLRETLYQEISGQYVLADESQSGLRMFNDLDEDMIDAAASWNSVFSGVSGLPASFKVGGAYTERQRDFSSRRFRFIPLNVVRYDLTQTPEQHFTPENIGPRFEMREETRATDFYTAEQTVAAAFAMVDLSLSQRARLVGGVRLENYDQRVDTFDLFDVDVDGEVETIQALIEETDLFPSVNLVYDLGGSKNLRVGYSQTVNRPEFRELAPFEFTDIVGGRAVVGNPELERSLIQNVDVRWEWFPGAQEVIAASFFFKAFDQPIERFVEPTAQLRTSFQNAESARNIGFELEARRELFDGFLVGGNYSFVDSSITLQESQTNVLTTLERPLSGTSKNVFNALIEGQGGPVTGRLLFNYFGDRIVDVGSLGLPDIFEEGRTTVDAVVTARFSRIFSLRFSAENLTDAPVLFQQGSEDHRRYTLGRVFGLQFSVTP
jgi:outer membrane receptor protein involved in Fe transport